MRREQRFVFGEVADLYDRARPGYPEAMVDDVLRFCGLPAPRVLEVGAGTGKATVAFAARGLEILALEPTPEMAASAARNCAAYPGVTVEVGAFEEWQGSGASFDLVIAAQSWQWLRPGVRGRKAREELRAGGALALFWNIPLWEDAGLRRELDAVYERHAPELVGLGAFPGLRASKEMASMLEELDTSGLFEPLTQSSYRWSVAYSVEGWLDLLNTHSDHRLLPEARRLALLDAVAEALNRRGGAFEMAYETQLYLAHALI
jgi:SAM-dependent methyltransferase